MYIPNPLKAVIETALELSQKNNDGLPDSNNLITDAEYDDALTWLSAFEASAIDDYDTSRSVEICSKNAKPGDLFRPLNEKTSEPEGDWKLLLGSKIMQQSWEYAIAYADPGIGVFEGIHTSKDSEFIEVLTMCRVCSDNQAVKDSEVIVNDMPKSGPVCENCYFEYNRDYTNS